MKKIYTKTVFEFDKKSNKYFVNDNNSHYYYIDDNAPISQMKGRGMSDEEREYINALQSQARGTPLQSAGEEAIKGLLQTPDIYTGDLGGDISGYLKDQITGDPTKSPGFQSAVQSAYNRQLPTIESAFERGGRSGSGLEEKARQGAFGDIYGDIYEREQQRRLQAAGLGQEGLDENIRNKLIGLGLIPQFQQGRARDVAGLGDVLNLMNAIRNRRRVFGRAVQGSIGGGISGAALGAETGNPYAAAAGGVAGGVGGLLTGMYS